MNLTEVRVYEVNNVKARSILANVYLNFEDTLVITGCRLIDNGSRGRFLSMPSEKVPDRDGEIRYIDRAYIMDKRMAEDVLKTVETVYDKMYRDRQKEAKYRL